jgi:hypothetical protein
LSGRANTINYSDEAVIVGGYNNCITGGSEGSIVLGGYDNRVCDYSDNSIISGYENCIVNDSLHSSIIGGCRNQLYCSCNSSILGGYNNRLCNADCSSVIGGYNNRLYSHYFGTLRGSSILGGIYNCINANEGFVCSSAIIGGYSNDICCDTCNSVIIGGCNNVMYCSDNSVILGGYDLNICGRDNSVFLNATTYLKQTVEKSEEITATSSVTANFLDGNIKYLSSLSDNFQVDFINFPDPTYSNSVINYTLILNQGATSSMINGLTVNGVTASIKWYNGTQSGTANQVDKIGLMFVYNGSGTLSQVLGQVETFA